MQESNTQSPDSYDWTEFTRRERGFTRRWAINHGFSYVTLHHLVHGIYRSGSGPKISRIMAAAGLLIGAVPTNAFGDKHGNRPTDRQDD